MRDGLRTEEIEIQRRIEVGRTPINEPIYEWESFCCPLVEYETRRGREHLNAGRVYMQSYVIFRMPMDEIEGVDGTMRILYEGDFYEIRNIRVNYPMMRDAEIEAYIMDLTV